MGRGEKSIEGELNRTPWDALLQEVRRSSYRVWWLDQRIQEESDHEAQLMYEVEPGERREMGVELRKWLQESRKEREHLMRVCGVAIKSGLSERYVHSITVEAQMIVRVLSETLDSLGLSNEDRRKAAVQMRRSLDQVTQELHNRHDDPFPQRQKPMLGM